MKKGRVLVEKRNRDDEDDNKEWPHKICSIDEDSDIDEDNGTAAGDIDADKENWYVIVSFACSDANNHDRHSIRLFFLLVHTRTVQAPIHHILSCFVAPNSKYF